MDALLAFFQVILIDVVLAGDNALAIGALSSKLPPARRSQAIVFGIAAAIVARLFLSLTAAWLMLIPAIGLVGGALLLYIAWKLWRDHQNADGDQSGWVAPSDLLGAVRAIVLADVSMSLDNVLGVAGAAKGHWFSLVIGLILSMVLMGAAANWIASQMSRRPWLSYVGIGAIALAGVNMIVEAA